MQRYLSLVLLLLLLFSCRNESSKEELVNQQSDNSISVSLKNDTIMTADRCEISVIFTYRQDYIPRLPDWRELFDPIEIYQIEAGGTVLQKGEYFQREVTITLDHLLPGDYILKPVIIRLEKVNNNLTLHSDYMNLSVQSSLLDGEHFLDSIEPLNEKRSPLLFIVLSSLLLILVLVILFFLRKKRQNKSASLPLTDEIYRNRILSVQADNDDRVYYSELSSIIKEYLDNTIMLSVQSSTAQEIALLTEKSNLFPEKSREKLLAFLLKAEMIVFNREIPIKADREEDKNQLLSLIESIGEVIKEEVDV